VNVEQTLGEIIAAALGHVEPKELAILHASWGDVDALRELANAAYNAVSAPNMSKPLAYMEAITFQRLAAAQGDKDDQRTIDYARRTRH
jgi:hypothetical protein